MIILLYHIINDYYGIIKRWFTSLVQHNLGCLVGNGRWWRMGKSGQQRTKYILFRANLGLSPRKHMVNWLKNTQQAPFVATNILLNFWWHFRLCSTNIIVQRHQFFSHRITSKTCKLLLFNSDYKLPKNLVQFWFSDYVTIFSSFVREMAVFIHACQYDELSFKVGTQLSFLLSQVCYAH